MGVVSAARLCIRIIPVLMLFTPGMAMALSPCRGNTLENAKVVVEASVKSLSIGVSGLLLENNDFPDRMMRVELDIKRVVKGTFKGRTAILYGVSYPPPERFFELTVMAMLVGLSNTPDTFEWELSPMKVNDDFSFYSLNNCNYSKFPAEILQLKQP